MSDIVIEPIYSFSKINSSNHHDHAPFSVKGDLLHIEKEWWESLPKKQREKILEDFGNEYGYCLREKENMKKYDETTGVFWKFYNAYINSYNALWWHECLEPPYSMSLIDEETLNGLEHLSALCVYRSRKITKDQTEFFNSLIATSIRKFIEKYKASGVFMKVSDESGKHSSKLTPKFSLEEIIEEIAHNKDMIKSLLLYKEKSYLLLKPWCYEIDKNNEFRVIIQNRFVVAISQQQCYKYAGLTSERMKTVASSILSFYEEMKDSIPYKSAVLDVWVDRENVTHLIEINPGELWASSGSALFEWETDFAKLHQREKTYIRYIDIQSPLLLPLVSPVSLTKVKI